MTWGQTTARKFGYVLVTKRSNKNSDGDVCKVLLKCDRGGEYKGLGSTSSRSTKTKKINYPFQLEGYFTQYGGWRVHVKDYKHNHVPADYLGGHSFGRRLTQAEKDFLERSWQVNLLPFDMLANLKREFPENKSTTKDIYNAITGLKEKEAGQLGSAPIQALLSLLHDNNYTFQFTTNDVTNRMENLFFVHPTSFNLVRAFRRMLFIDATYKTNIYNMPFVQIAGVTSTSKTFCVACAFIMDETTVTYKWVLQCLRKMIGEGMDVCVILTDRERALINACVDVLNELKTS